MKFWQLASITSDDVGVITRVASTRPIWKQYESLSSNFSSLVKAQDRVALDSMVTTDFAVAVLGEIQRNFYLSSDNWLRSWQLDTTDQALPILEAFKRYGADIVEFVCERGATQI